MKKEFPIENKLINTKERIADTIIMFRNENFDVAIGNVTNVEIARATIPLAIIILASVIDSPRSFVNHPVKYGRNIPQVKKNKKKFLESQF